MVRTLRERQAVADIELFFYENGFANWFITHARSSYGFDWLQIIAALRSGRFFFPQNSYFSVPGETIIPDQRFLGQGAAQAMGEEHVEHLTALAATLSQGEDVRRSLELEGLRVDAGKLTIEPAGSLVNEQQEENLLVGLVKQGRLQNEDVILRHLGDAHELFVQGKDHASIGESRNLIQALIDDISAATNANGGHSVGYPAGMANRLQYLQDVGFFTTDEKTAFGTAWGFLSAGSHPGIPSRDEARIGLILSLEFGQLLLLKFANWAANGFQAFS